MIHAIHGPLVYRPEQWVVVFEPAQPGHRWLNLVPGRYKHVRLYGYVPFLHVWLFVDPYLAGIEIHVAAHGAPADELADAWTRGCDIVVMPRREHMNRSVAAAGFGWCVPVVKRLIGLNSGALRPDSLFADCIANGGKRYELQHAHSLDDHGLDHGDVERIRRSDCGDEHEHGADRDRNGADRNDRRGHPDLHGARH